MTHRLLKRQLRKLGLDEQSPPTPEQWQEFLRRVERTYTESDKDRYLLERSMTISSQEMQRLYKQLQEASETQIAAERDKLQAVLSSVGEGLCAYDANGELMFINPAAEAILGWSEAELRAQQTPLLDLIRVEPEIPTASLLTNDQILEKLHTGTPYRNDDGLFRRQDGSVFPASYLFNPVLKNGVYQGFVLVFRDITAWKQANEAVRVSETRYRDLFENANDLIQSVAPDGSFLYVNRAWLETLGYSAEEVHDLNLKDIVHPDCEALCVESFQRVMQGEAVSGLEITFVTKDGRSIIVEGNASASFDESGHPVATRGIFRDITERKRAEAELEKSLSLLQATFEAVADGILAVDQHGKVLALNQKYIDMWQIPSDIVATKNDNDLLAAMLEQVKDPERFIARIQKLYNSPETESIDIIELKDGRIFEQYTTPQYIGDKIVGRVWNYRDITTKTLTEQALRRAKEEAEAANRAKSAFLASMSHELRTPLAAIIGYSELLQELTDVDDDILAPRLQKIEVSANHLLSLISDILDMSKIEAGKIELFYETFSTQSLL
ncbi:MAG: PAS domain S-box protein, partial [Chloroflexi bacterium]